MEASPAVARLLDGLVDMHCHSGPAPFPREFDHVDAAREGDRIGMRAFVSKSHHHSTVMDIKAAHRSFEGIGTTAYGGIVLNNQVGGLNPYAVEMCVRMGGKIVWFPTFSSRRHIEYHDEAVSQGFPESAVQLTTVPVLVHDETGAVRPEVAAIADIVEEAGAVFNGGHLHADDLFDVFSIAADRGVTRMAVSHPNFITDLTPQQGKDLADMGVFIEHEVGMYLPNEQPFFSIDTLLEWLEVVGTQRSYFASDLGQIGRTHPVDAFIHVATELLDRGVPEREVRRMFVETPTWMLRLDGDD